jgi:6-phosphogluconolactonase (cycloisomerase 2 family)
MLLHATAGGRHALLAIVATLAALTPAAVQAQGAFVNFESGHVRPLAMAPSGNLLFAVNTPDNRLAIYTVSAGGLSLAAEVPVGLEPVAVASRVNAAGRTEAWVVNHLSDSVSIVEVHPSDILQSRVVRTLLVGDEPRDIVFAGTAGSPRAFITTARRGQNLPASILPNLTTEGEERALVWTFDAENLGAPLSGTPLSVIECFGDTPRALAASSDGTRVYAAVFHSGNRTTGLIAELVSQTFGPLTPPPGATPNEPDTGLIAKFNPANGQWNDVQGRNWAPLIAYSLPDRDVFVINATANPPALVSTNNAVVGVGTVLFNMAVRPGTQRVFVANLESRNNVRFEPLSAGGVQGHIAESRLTIINGTTPTARHLNPHIAFNVATGSQAERDQSLAFPGDMVFSGGSGDLLFVTAFGSAKIAAYDTNQLEAGTVSPDLVDVGEGPSGIVLDTPRNRLYVMNRIDHTISIVDNALTAARAESAVVPLRYDPSPPEARDGRRFLYDAHGTSGHGDNACASCHIFGDFDSLAWDLGDPFGAVEVNPNPFRAGSGGPFHPMKGPMTTQSLRGMANAGPMHWRGDRTGGNDPGGDPLDEDAAFKKFNPAFVGLLGRAAQLTAAEMQAFTDFILTVRYPPNPIRALTDVGTSQQNQGETFFNTTPVDGGATCVFCHALPFGTDGFSSFEGESQEFKIAHLRNAYAKVGMFGLPNGVLGGTGNVGEQVRGFGYLHDGAIPTVFDFIKAPVFNFANDTQRRNVEAFVLAFDTGLKPAVGQQVSVTPSTVSDVDVIGRIDLLIGRDDAANCELVVKGVLGGVARGWVYTSGNNFRSDRASEPLIDKTSLRLLASTTGQEQIYTCVPPGSGTRIGIDRDEDTHFDRDEILAGSDPANPNSVPSGGTATPTSTAVLTATPTSTGANTATATPTHTFTATATASHTGTATFTATAPNTPTATFTATRTGTATFTPTPSLTPTRTATPTDTPLIDCAGSVTIDAAKLRISRNSGIPGDERITIKGELVLSVLSPPIDPIANGISFKVIDRFTSTTVFSREVPGGAGDPGWGGGSPKWKFRDNQHQIPGAGGVDKVLVKDLSSRQPGRFKFRIKGSDADFGVTTESLELIVTLGGPAEGNAGQCGRVLFNNAAGPDPRCTFIAGGASIRCD